MNQQYGADVPLPRVRDQVAEHAGKSFWVALVSALFILAGTGHRLAITMLALAALMTINAVIALKWYRRDLGVWGDDDR